MTAVACLRFHAVRVATIYWLATLYGLAKESVHFFVQYSKAIAYTQHSVGPHPAGFLLRGWVPFVQERSASVSYWNLKEPQRRWLSRVARMLIAMCVEREIDASH